MDREKRQVNDIAWYPVTNVESFMEPTHFFNIIKKYCHMKYARKLEPRLVVPSCHGDDNWLNTQI